MDPSAIERNTKASLNGQFCEDYVKRNVPGIEWVGDTYDAMWNGKPVDVKGCEAWYDRHDLPNATRRAGRVTLEPEQKSEIEKGDGFYLCVVHIGELVIKSFFVPAVKVPDVKQLSWTTMQKIASEAC